MSNKKSIMTEALVRLVIVAFVIGTVVYMGCKVGNELFRRTRGAEQSFNKLSDIIIEVGRGEYGEEAYPFVLIMDKETSITGFTKNTDLFEVRSVRQGVDKEKAIPSLRMEKLKDICMEERACLCLCRKGFEFIRSPPTFKCKQMICNELPEDLDFWKDLFIKEVEEAFQTYQLYHDGFMIYRSKKTSPLKLGLIQFWDRSGTIYIQKKDDKIYVCGEPPCFKEVSVSD